MQVPLENLSLPRVIMAMTSQCLACQWNSEYKWIDFKSWDTTNKIQRKSKKVGFIIQWPGKKVKIKSKGSKPNNLTSLITFLKLEERSCEKTEDLLE